MPNENTSLIHGEDGMGHSSMRQRTMSGVSQRSIPNVPYYRPSATSETGLMSPDGPSDARKYFMIFCASLITLFTAGIIFGFAAIKPIFIREGAYAHLCEKPSPEGCAEQKLQLDLMFTLGSFFINVAAFPVGVFLDYTGPRITSTCGTIIEITGLLLLAYSSESFDGYMAGFICLALGGLCMFLSNINLMNLFPAYMGTINGILTGCFDASSLIFMLFKQASVHFGALLKTMWLGYLAVPIFNQFFAMFFLSNKQFEADVDFEDDDEGEEAQKPLIYNLHDLSAKEQMMATEYWMAGVFIAIYMLRLNFYIATVKEQLVELQAPEDIEALNDAFNVILPLGGVLSIPIVSYLLDNMGSIVTFNFLGACMIIFGITSMLPGYWWAIISFIVFVVGRTCLYASVTDYTGRMFGFKTFGTIYGMLMMIAGFGNLLQYPIDNYVIEKCNHSFFKANLTMTIFSLLLFVLPVYLYRERERRFNSQYTPIN